MSSVGLSEWVLLALLGLIVLGPERLPRIANQLGSWIGQARRMTRVMKRQLEEEMDLEKSNSIKPPESAPMTTPADVEKAAEHTPANEDDDTYSPAHNADNPGMGVTDEDQAEEPETEEPETEDQPVADQDEKETKL
jgi:sec-independent protein translocase protein TatB